MQSSTAQREFGLPFHRRCLLFLQDFPEAAASMHESLRHTVQSRFEAFCRVLFLSSIFRTSHCRHWFGYGGLPGGPLWMGRFPYCCNVSFSPISLQKPQETSWWSLCRDLSVFENWFLDLLYWFLVPLFHLLCSALVCPLMISSFRPVTSVICVSFLSSISVPWRRRSWGVVCYHSPTS